ncbi:MAG: relaxase/mobilization nuclease domain-containing protein [Clostridiales bacterium]|nr:relaxase/mobilization nuclease domain-containing protein [Clostridiales bacterium]
MATTSLWRVKGYIGKLILYTSNPEKTTERQSVVTGNDDTDPEQALGDVISYAQRDDATDKKEYVYALNCGVKNAKEDMMKTKRKFKKTDGVIAYHGFQSFAEGEVTPDTAFEIGKKLADELWGDEFQVLVTTHLDKESHIHNHFVINTVSIKDGHKFHRTKQDYYRMREVSDRLCREYGFSVIEHPKDKGMSYAEWQAEQDGKQTIRGAIRAAIDTAIRGSQTKAEFLDAMDQMGFVIDQSGKYPKIKQVGNERFVRFKSLGEGYDIEDILRRIYENDRPMYPRIPEQENPHQIFEGEKEPVALMTFVPLYRSYNRALKLAEERPRTNRRIYFLVRQDTSSMRLYVDSARLVTQHNLHTKQDVLAYKQYAMDLIDQYIKERKDARNALKRAQRTGDVTLYNHSKYNIGVLTRRLSKLRREVTTCDEVIERSEHVKENLMRIEQKKFRGKEEINYEHIGRRGRSSRENEP